MRLDDRAADPKRFVPQDGSRRSARVPRTIVQVQFAVPLAPLNEAVETESNFRMVAPHGANLPGIHELFRSHGLIKSEPSFRRRRADLSPDAALSASELNQSKFVDLHFPPGTDLPAIVAELRARPDVEQAIVMPAPIPANQVPSDPLIGSNDKINVDPRTGLEHEWYIFRCYANDAWTGASGKGVIIADIDFGFLLTHQDLAPNLDLTHAYNSVDGSTNVSAGNNIDHGTAVLGLAAAAGNSEGMAGFAYRATIWPIQANGATGATLPGDAVANAIDWVMHTDSGGKRIIVNIEAQTDTYYANYESVPAVNSAIRAAIAQGLVVCVAAGNGDMDAAVGDDGTPIPETGSILVGATIYGAADNQRGYFSNYGPRVVVSAPGDLSHDVTCGVSAPDAYVNGFGGTSGAVPKVAGTIALMLEVNSSLTHDQIKQILVSTGGAIPNPDGKPIGVFLNTAAAVKAAARQS